MKEWWQQLASREKNTVMVGGVVVLLFLIYALIWSPISSGVARLRNNITKNQQLLVWLQGVDKQLRILGGSQSETTTEAFTSPAALLGWLQSSIQQAGIARQLTQIKEGADESITLHFQEIDFDTLIAWLVQAKQEQHFNITQMTVIKLAAPGVVQVDLVLQARAES